MLSRYDARTADTSLPDVLADLKREMNELSTLSCQPASPLKCSSCTAVLEELRAMKSVLASLGETQRRLEERLSRLELGASAPAASNRVYTSASTCCSAPPAEGETPMMGRNRAPSTRSASSEKIMKTMRAVGFLSQYPRPMRFCDTQPPTRPEPLPSPALLRAGAHPAPLLLPSAAACPPAAPVACPTAAPAAAGDGLGSSSFQERVSKIKALVYDSASKAGAREVQNENFAPLT